MSTNQILKSLAVFASVLLSYNFWNIVSYFSLDSVQIVTNPYLDSFLFNCLWAAPVVITSFLLFGKEALEISGIMRSPLKGLFIGLTCCVPLFIIFAFAFPMNENFNPFYVFQNSLLSGFFEELIFRTFFFGALYGLLRWRFWPAVLLNAAIFSYGHLYQAHDFLSSFLTIFVTSIGAIWFAWLYIRWNYSIWVPMVLHTLMNLSWHLFSVADGTAGGGVISYVARASVIAVSIYLTLKYTPPMKPITGEEESEKKPEKLGLSF
ncbi:CPBP family intramembrane glutamic endopeptidase [Algoriphagus sediminis]|uniref:CPBP family intramembrane metalloprotease n=1 Tax=Algoriphagus sediminis TaxID=3057113 RepID=A0ABT7YA11_9BACT|nr:CPBP family intramembrane glutamic endopeptidase [Algoriphagus sediminis]MDN3203348.1 CPBP family intramembrane metalloprotease [Algoriphagus sediminis]